MFLFVVVRNVPCWQTTVGTCCVVVDWGRGKYVQILVDAEMTVRNLQPQIYQALLEGQ